MEVKLGKKIFFEILQTNSFVIGKNLLKIIIEELENKYEFKIIQPLSKTVEKNITSKFLSIKRSWKRLKGGKMRNLFKAQNENQDFKIIFASSEIISNLDYFTNLENEVQFLKQKLSENESKLSFLENQYSNKSIITFKPINKCCC